MHDGGIDAHAAHRNPDFIRATVLVLDFWASTFNHESEIEGRSSPATRTQKDQALAFPTERRAFGVIVRDLENHD